MGRTEALEAQVGELEGELRALLDEYVEVQQRIQTLEELTGREGERAAERAVADLPSRLREVAEATDRPESSAGEAEETSELADQWTNTSASQEEVAAAVEQVETDGEAAGPTGRTETETDAGDGTEDDDGLGDIIVG